MLDRYDQDLLLDYLEGELDAHQRAQLEAELADDPQLAMLLEGMARDREVLRSLPREHAPASLVEDVTQTLERRMLLDEDPGDAGPIPIARARDPYTTTNGIRWGRIGGLSGLAAAVAIAAGVVVYTFDTDPLNQIEQELADSNSPTADADETAGNTDAVASNGANADGRASTPPFGREADNQTPALQQQLAEIHERLTRSDNEIDAEADADPGTYRFAHNDPETSDAVVPGVATTPGARAAEDLAGVNALAGGSTVALATAQPRQQLVVYTDEPDNSREMLVAFCVNNGIPIVHNDFATNGVLDGRIVTSRSSGNVRERTDASDQPAGPDELQAQGHVADALADAPVVEDRYALLINKTQLAALVSELNGAAVSANLGATAEGSRVIEEPGPFCEQVAVVNELIDSRDAQAGRHEQQEQFGDAVGNEDAAQAEAPDTTTWSAAPRGVTGSGGTALDEAERLRQQEARRRIAPEPVELRLPDDLGSPYANTRNRDNLTTEQRRNAFQYSANQIARQQTIAGVSDPDNGTFALRDQDREPTPNAAAGNAPVPGNGVQADAAEEPQQPADTSTDAAPEATTQPLVQQGPVTEPQADDSLFGVTVPTRVNWLGSHLPSANTTPIINWQLEYAEDPSELVPIAIQFAPSEQLRAVLRRDVAGDEALLDETQVAEEEAAPTGDAEAAEAEAR